jgi:transcriptional regulator with XRE-family HTH domain
MCMVDQKKFFKELGSRIRAARKKRNFSQEDMIGFGFSARHWQQIEAGRPITLTTLLRVGDALDAAPEKLIHGLFSSLRKVSRVQ